MSGSCHGGALEGDCLRAVRTCLAGQRSWALLLQERQQVSRCIDSLIPVFSAALGAFPLRDEDCLGMVVGRA